MTAITATAPPSGHLPANDLKTGQFAWRIPFGEYPELVAQVLKDPGSESYGGGIATASGLFIIAATDFDRKMRAFESKSGKLLWDVQLGGTVRGIPIAYGVDGKKYVAIAAGNALFSFALP